MIEFVVSSSSIIKHPLLGRQNPARGAMQKSDIQIIGGVYNAIKNKKGQFRSKRRKWNDN
jgi:hypothetical protein